MGIYVFSKNTIFDSTSRQVIHTDYNMTTIPIDSYTTQLQWKYKIRVFDPNDDEIITIDIPIWATEGEILENILTIIPFLLGNIEIKSATSYFIAYLERRELFWITFFFWCWWGYTLIVEDSAKTPLSILSHPFKIIPITNNSTYIPSPNKPYYEIIPAIFLTSMKSSLQVTMTINRILGICSISWKCDFGSTTLSGDISLDTANSDYTLITETGTEIPVDLVIYITLDGHTCHLDPSYTHTSTLVRCKLTKLCAGDYTTKVQTN